MTYKNKITACLLALLVLGGCSTSGQNSYNASEVGKASTVEFGTVLNARPVAIKGTDSGAGSVIGGVAGGAAGSAFGNGGGRVATVIGGALLGALAGNVAEKGLSGKNGMEYTVALQNGTVLTIPQYINKDEPIFQNGDHVMVQKSGAYQRVLPASQLPSQVQRPAGVKVVN